MFHQMGEKSSLKVGTFFQNLCGLELSPEGIFQTFFWAIRVALPFDFSNFHNGQAIL